MTGEYICTNDGLSKLERDGDSYNVTSWSFGAVVLTGYSLGGKEVLVGTSKGLARFSESWGLRVVDDRLSPYCCLCVGSVPAHRLFHRN